MEDVLMEYDYMRYLEATMDEQFDLEQYVLETVGVAFNESQRLEVFTEGVGEKIKNAWGKFVEWIKKVWNKFLERLAKTFSNAKGYLEQYKDIILKKKVKEGYTVELPNYRTGIDRIFRTTVDVIQPGDITKVMTTFSDTSKLQANAGRTNSTDNINIAIENVIKLVPAWAKLRQIFQSGDTVANVDQVDFSQDNETIRTTMKQYFLGGQAKTYNTDDSTIFNMADMYEFCYNYEKIVANIEKDKDNFFKTSTNISNTIDAEAKKIVNNDTEKTKSAKDVTAGNAKSVDAAFFNSHQDKEEVKEESAILHEEIRSATGTTNNTSGAQGSGSASDNSGSRVSAVDASKNNIGKDAASTDDYKHMGSNVGRATNAQTASTENATKYIDLVVKTLNKYRDECVDTLTAEMNAATQISKDYMDLITSHVRDYVGTPDNVADNTPMKNKTDYKGTQPNNQNKK